MNPEGKIKFDSRMNLPTSLLEPDELNFIKKNQLASSVIDDKLFKDKLIIMSENNFKHFDNYLLTTSSTSRAFALRVVAKALRYRTDKSDETLKASILAIATGLYSYAPMEAERLQRAIR